MTQTQAPERPTAPPEPAPLGAWELARWAWRQLTSMRTALLLLFLLALASVPGSLIPQRRVNPVTVAEFARQHPELARWYDRLGLFDVFGSAWFAAIYLALLVSLLGCILPRAVRHARRMWSPPPPAPRRLHRLPASSTWTTSTAADELAESVVARLRARRYRVALRGPATAHPTADARAVGEDGARTWTVSAERGYSREIGNLLFHVAIVVVLVGVAVGSLFGFRGTALVIVGNGFANTVTQYDGYQAGAFFEESQLPPFALTVRDFQARWEVAGEQAGAPRAFDARLTYTEAPGAPEREYRLRVNHPLRIGPAQIHLIGHGYAPRFTVRDGNGEVAFSGPVPFLPQDGRFTSTGVVKVPDARPTQLGFQGFFLPTAVVDDKLGPVSAFPEALSPSVYLTAYHGDLGLDDGVPQSVYRLRTDGLTQFRTANGDALRLALSPGQSAELPNGAGTIRFDGYERWVNLQISSNPGEPIALFGALLGLAGLLLSLVVRPRRIWVRLTQDAGRTTVTIAGLDKGERLIPAGGPSDDDTSTTGPAEGDDDLAVEIETIAAGLPGRAAADDEEHQ
jgi:cytochrome c biogenesis protein